MKKFIFIVLSIITFMSICTPNIPRSKETENVMGYSKEHLEYLETIEDWWIFARFGCAEIQEDGSVLWAANYDHINAYMDPTESYNKYLPYLLQAAECYPTDDVLTDVELIEFYYQCSLPGQTYEREWTVYLAYDYHLKNVYINKDGTWYRTVISSELNDIILYGLDVALGFQDSCWKIQSQFRNDWIDYDLDNLIFRYHVYWRPTETLSAEENSYKSIGFRNTTPCIIENQEQAIARAAQEMGYENPIGVAFYDKTCGYWMVELYDDKGYEWKDTNEYAGFLFENTWTVIMDDKGITLETYQYGTSFLLFSTGM